MTRVALVAVLATSACVGDDLSADDVCSTGRRSLAMQAVDRQVVGVAAPYPADVTLRGRTSELSSSQSLRRTVAWRVVSSVLESVMLADIDASTPRWRTWYGRDEMQRLFQHLYQGLGAAARRDGGRFDDAALDDAFGWNGTSLAELIAWTPERYEAYVESLDDEGRRAGVGGIGRVSYSPSASRHLLASYPEVLACDRDGAPPSFDEGTGDGGRVAVREPLRLAACGQQDLGPYFVATGETLRATLDAAGADMATLTARVGGNEVDACALTEDGACEVPGPATVRLSVEAGGEGLAGALAIDYGSATPDWAGCLQSSFPVDAVVVKADWRRVLPGVPLPSYDTSADSMRRRLGARGALDWADPDGARDPKADAIYTVTLENGNSFRLAALHIMTKELDHWLWITLWWSASPDVDFGADRPASLAGPWRNYKMCVVTDFVEHDADPTGGFTESAPTLAAALKATHGGVGQPTWCSNPYLEVGPDNAASNCIGCHQHGGAATTEAEILGDEATFPGNGRLQVRNNFPSDYSWSVVSGDQLGAMMAEIVAYFASVD